MNGSANPAKQRMKLAGVNFKERMTNRLQLFSDMNSIRFDGRVRDSYKKKKHPTSYLQRDGNTLFIFFIVENKHTSRLQVSQSSSR